MGSARAAVTMVYTPLGGVPISLSTALETSTAYIETKALALGQEELSAFIDKVLFNISDRSDQTRLVLEIYGADDEDGDPVPGGGREFTLLDRIETYRREPAYTGAEGKRFHKLRFIDTNVKERWRLHGFTIFGEPGGDEF